MESHYQQHFGFAHEKQNNKKEAFIKNASSYCFKRLYTKIKEEYSQILFL